MRHMKRGAIGMNILLFMFIGAAMLFLVGFGSTAQNVFAFTGINPTTGVINGGQLALVFGGLLVGAAIIIGTFSFPNPYAIFAPIALGILAIIATVWASFINDAGFPTTLILGQNIPVIGLVIGGALGFLSLLSVIAFLKGGEW